MKKVITIKSLTLENFKGQKRLHIDFENQTDIYGANGTGKTTIADGVNWLWFGKDSSDRKDFEIKTLDVLGKVIPMIEHTVSAVYDIDGDIVTMKRVLKESWVKKRGSLEAEFAGNVTDLYWNDVPMNVGDFNKKVNAILDEQLFKMITSVTYFNSIDWKQKRTILTAIVGEVSDADIASGNTAYEELLAKLTQGKTLEEYKLQIANSIKKAKDDLKNIPTRIDEVSRTKPEAQDFEALQGELNTKQVELNIVEGQLTDSNTAFDAVLNSQRDLKVKINNVGIEISNIESETRNEARQRLTPDTSALDKLTKDLGVQEGEITSYKNTNSTLEQKQKNIQSEIDTTVTKMNGKRTEWETENAKELVFDDNNFCCPTCERDYESGDVQAKKSELLATFKSAKTQRLSEINTEGQRLKSYKESLENELRPIPGLIQGNLASIADIESKIEDIKAGIASLNNASTSELPSEESVYESIISLHPTYQQKKSELAELQSQVVESPKVDNTELANKKSLLVNEIDNLKGRLNLKTQIDSVNSRVAELKEEGSKLSQQIADVEKEQFIIENFIKEKIDRLEAAINSKFNMVNFKMFEEQINGGMRETCVAMVNGVPFTDLNTASRMNCGIDIINTLCDYYGVSAPIFIDNAESVHTLIPTDSQLVRLVVSKFHKQLEVKTKELAA